MINLLLAAALLFTNPSSEEEAVLATVDATFEAFYAGDSARMEPLLAEGVQLWPLTLDASKDMPVRKSPPLSREAWLAQIEGEEGRFAEVYWDPVVQIRAERFAHVWTPFVIYADGERVHCGIDAFTLMKPEDKWLITDLAFTMEPQACDELGWPEARARVRPASLRPHLPQAE